MPAQTGSPAMVNSIKEVTHGGRIRGGEGSQRPLTKKAPTSVGGGGRRKAAGAWEVMKALLTGWSTGLEWRWNGVTREQ